MRLSIQFREGELVYGFESPFVPRVGDYITFILEEQVARIKVERIDYDVTGVKPVVRLFTKSYESGKRSF